MTDREFGFMLKIAEHRHSELMGLLKEAVNPRMAREMGKRQSPVQNTAGPAAPVPQPTTPAPASVPRHRSRRMEHEMGMRRPVTAVPPNTEPMGQVISDAGTWAGNAIANVGGAIGEGMLGAGRSISRGVEARDVRTNPYYQRAEEERKRNAALIEAQKQQAKTTRTSQTPQAPQGSLLSRVDAIRKEKATEPARPTVSGRNGPTEAPVNGRREDWLSQQASQPWRRNSAAFNQAAGFGTTLAPATFSRPTLARSPQNTGTGIFQNGVEVPRSQIGRSPWGIARAPRPNAGVSRQLSRVRRAATSV